jgi:Glycoside hydrolase 97.
MELLGSIPTTWDETKILDGKVGEYIVTARRKGKNWYVAALNNSTPRDITLQFDFLSGNNFKTTICKDGLNAHNYGADYELIDKFFEKTSVETIHLAPGGGFLMRLQTIE